MAYEARTEPELHSDLCVPNVVRSQLFGARSDLSSIFADVEKRLPSIDSDFSDTSSDDGDTTIFQRVIKTNFDDDQLPADYLYTDHPIDELLQHQNGGQHDGLTTTTTIEDKASSSSDVSSSSEDISCITEPILRRRQNDDTSFSSVAVSSCGMERSHPSSTAEEYDTSPEIKRDTWVSDGDSSYCSCEQLTTKNMDIRKCTANVTKIKETKANRVSDKCEKMVLNYISHEAPKLSHGNINFEQLEFWQENGSGERILDILPPPESCSPSQEDGESLIDKLARLSQTQSGLFLHDLDPDTGAPQFNKSTRKEAKTLQNLAVIKKKISSMGTNTNDLANLPRESLGKSRDTCEARDTIYIDLRHFDREKQARAQDIAAVSRILNISECSSSSGEDEDTSDQLWHERRKEMKRQLMQAAEQPAGTKIAPRKTCTSSVGVAVKPATRTHAQRLAGHLPADFGKRKTGPGTHGGCEENGVQVLEDTEEVDENKSNVLTQQKDEITRKLREERDRERQTRLRLRRHLEALRPTTAVGSKLACAEATETLFDLDACYEPAPACLPSTLSPDTECVLLTVNLSCSGDIATYGGHAKSIDAGAGGLSASYPALLTWLLSLVPPADPDDPPPPGGAPFRVIGLQQALLDGQLCLLTAVTPAPHTVSTRERPPKARKSKTKRGAVSASSPFHKLLSQFLAANTLPSVCPWLADIVPLDVGTATGGGGGGVVYTPSVPRVSHHPLAAFVHINASAAAVRRRMTESVAFFWQTVGGGGSGGDEARCHHSDDGDNDGLLDDTQVSMSLLSSGLYRDENALIGVLSRVLQEGLDLAGVRLLYPATSPRCPLLAIAVRGASCRPVWLEAIGPADPALARRTDPHSLCALFGGGEAPCPLVTPRGAAATATQLARWFGGRVPAGGVVVAAGRTDGQTPPATLVAATRSDVFLVVAPLVPSGCCGMLLALCEKRGYQLRGVKRAHLASKQASSLGISSEQYGLYVKCGNSSTQTQSSALHNDWSRSNERWPARPCTIFILRKENALRNAASLLELFMVQLSRQNLLGPIQVDCGNTSLTTSLLFHVAAFNESTLGVLGGDFSAVLPVGPGCLPSYIAPKLYSNPEMEQIAVVTFTGHRLMKTLGSLLGQLLNVPPYSRRHPASRRPGDSDDDSGGGGVSADADAGSDGGFELLGIKWLPSLSRLQAKELTPCEVGDRHWKESISRLASEAAVVLVLRGVAAFTRLRSFISERSPAVKCGGDAAGLPPLHLLLSPTPGLAYHQAMLFFADDELFAEPRCRALLPYLPPVGRSLCPETTGGARSAGRGSRGRPGGGATAGEESVLTTMRADRPRPLCTALVAGPEVVRRRHLARLLARVAHEGFAVVAMRLCVLDAVQAAAAVAGEGTQDGSLRDARQRSLCSGPSLLLSLRRENAVRRLVDLLGPPDPRDARRADCFYWRAIFGVDDVANGLHGSVDYLTAVKDHHLFFPDGVCCETTPDLIADLIRCDTPDSLIDLSSPSQREVKYGRVTSSEPTANGGCGVSPGLLAAREALTQTNCVLLTPTLLQTQTRGAPPAYVRIIDALLTDRCQLVGCRMLSFTDEQAQRLLHLCGDAPSCSLTAMLTSGPSIVMAVEGQSAVVAFDSSLGSPYDKDSLYSKYNSEILRGKDTKQAGSLLAFFFHELMPGAQAQIVINQNTLR